MKISNATAAPAKRTKRTITLDFQLGDEQAFLRAAIKGGRVLLTPVLANGAPPWSPPTGGYSGWARSRTCGAIFSHARNSGLGCLIAG